MTVPNLLIGLMLFTIGISIVGPKILPQERTMTVEEQSYRETGLSHFVRGILSWVSIAVVVASVGLFNHFRNAYLVIRSEKDRVRLCRSFTVFLILPVVGFLLSISRIVLTIRGLCQIEHPHLVDIIHSDTFFQLGFLFLYLWYLYSAINLLRSLKNFPRSTTDTTIQAIK
jgi:hypothetical protein